MYQTPDQPRQLRLDTTTACQAKCLSCHRFTTKRKGAMSMELIEEIIRDVMMWPDPLTEIVPVNYGEFFMFKEYAELLHLIETCMPRTNIVIPTNGMLMDEETISRTTNVRIVNVSINAYFPETYEAFMGMEPDFELLEFKIRKLQLLRTDISIWASMVHDPMYQSDLERDMFIKHWQALGAVPQVINAASANRPEKRPAIPRSRSCRSLFSDIVIGFDRKLSSCCWDAGFIMDLGKYTGDLKKDWRNPKLEGLRKLHNEGRRQEVDLCLGCTYE